MLRSLAVTPRALTRAQLRLLDLRQVWLYATLAALLLGALAFVLGYALGTRVPAAIAPPAGLPVAADKHFAVERIGQLSSRVQGLERDANYLLKALRRHEQITRQLSVLGAGWSGGKRPALGEGEGGALLPPRPCAGSAKPANLPHVEQATACLREVLDGLLEQVAQRNAALMAVPVRRPIAGSRLGSAFGNRIDPFTGRLAFHSGQDFTAPLGTPIRAAAGGRVITAGWQGEYGQCVELDHGNGLITRYAHAQALKVTVGEVVLPGQTIATLGSTGRSTGPHLHFEVLARHAFLDPQPFLALGALVHQPDALATH